MDEVDQYLPLEVYGTEASGTGGNPKVGHRDREKTEGAGGKFRAYLGPIDSHP